MKDELRHKLKEVEEAARNLWRAKRAKRLKRRPEAISGWMEIGATCLAMANGHRDGVRPARLPLPAKVKASFLEESATLLGVSLSIERGKREPEPGGDAVDYATLAAKRLSQANGYLDGVRP